MISATALALRDALTLAHEREPLLAFELPLRLVNVANEHAHWRVRQARAKKQRTAAALALRSALVRLERCEFTLSLLVVRIVRVAPRALDDDGAVAACKPVRDGIADALGVDDRDARVTWLVDQERGKPKEYACKVEVYAR